MTTVVNYNAAGGGSCGGGGGGNTNIINNFITNNNYTATGNGLLEGGGVIWLQDYDFVASPALYQIGGAQYSSPLTTVTLSPADATLDRIDVIAVNTDGVVEVIEGTLSATPAIPSVDPTSQLALSFVYVTHATSQPVNVSNEAIYLENTEWTGVAVGGGFDLASTNNPFQGTKDIEATAVVSGNSITYTKPAAGTLDPGDYNTLFFYIRSKAAWPANKQLTITLLNGTTQVGQAVTFKNGSFGFNSSVIGNYQQVVIPVSVFQATGLPITSVRMAVAGGGGSIGFYLDFWQFQSGVSQIPLAAPMIYQGIWNAQKAYETNDVVTIGSGASTVSYIALTPNVGQNPASSSDWRALSATGAGTGTVTSISAARGARTSSGSPITATGTIYGDETVNAQTGTSYALAATDRGALVTFSDAGAIAVSIAQAGTTGFENGYYVDIKAKTGSGTVTITPTTSTINGAANYALTAGQSIRVISDGTNYQVLAGGSVATGTVTSVDASGGVQTVSGSPITTTGTIRSANVINAQTGTSYALVSGDRGKHVTLSNASSIAVSIAQAGGAGFEDGYVTYVENIGAGAVTITPTTSTINGSATLVLNSNQGAILFSDGTNYRAMVLDEPSILVNSQTGTTYTYLAGDRKKLVTHSNASAIAATLPQATGAFGAGWSVWVENRGAGALTITPTTSTIDGASSLVLAQNQGVLLVSDGTNYFTARGSGATVNTAVMTYNSQSADYTAVLADANNGLLHPSADTNNRTFTIPANSSVAYAVGTFLNFANLSLNNLTIAITTDTLTLAGSTSTGSRTLSQNGTATAIKVTSTSWVVSGTGLS